MQRFTKTTPTADTANSQTITAVSATTQAFIIPHGETEPTDTTIGSEEGSWEYRLTSTTNVDIFTDGGNNSSHPGVKFEVVDWGNSDIRVQHLNGNGMTTAETTDTASIPTAITSGKAWLITTGTTVAAGFSESPSDFQIRADFQDTSTVRVRRGASGLAYNWSAQVIEDISAGGIWDTDVGNIAMTTAETSDTFTIGSVDTTKTFVWGTAFTNFGPSGQSPDTTLNNFDNAIATVTLTNATTITAARGVTDTQTFDIFVQAVEFLSAAAPTVTTNFATPGFNTAILHGTKTGGDNATEHGFAYSTDSALSTGVSTTTLGALNSNSSFTSFITSLSASTQYFFRAYATNGGGTGYGTIKSFTTGNSTATRNLRLFDKLKFIDGKVILYQQ